MSLLNGFNAAEVEPSAGFEPIPIDEYTAIISEAEEKRNSNDNGSLLSLCFDIVEGEYEGRKIFVNLNLQHPNAKAVEISRAELSAICRAVGVMTPQNPSELEDKPILIKVAVSKRKDTGEMQNVIKKYSPLKNATQSSPVTGEDPFSK